MKTKDFKAPFRVGDLLSAEEWNKTQRPGNRLAGDVRVVKVEQCNPPWCQSGWMVTGRDSKGREERLDSNWWTDTKKD